MSEQENIEIVRKIYSDFGEGNIAGILSVFADDLVFTQPAVGPSPLAGTYHGPEEVGAWFGKMEELTETLAFEPREFIGQGDRVVALGYYKFLAKPTGKSWESESAMVWTFRAGKATKFRFYGDTRAEAAAFSQ